MRSVWQQPVHGNPMVVMVTKLNRLKKVLGEWKNERFKKLSDQVVAAQANMQYLQQQLQLHPFNRDIASREK